MKTLFTQLGTLNTEQRNKRSMNIDAATVPEILRIINEEDKTVAYAVEKELPQIAKAVNLIVHSLKQSGRLLYVGAGTSGRLGVLDATECPPTYGTKRETVQGIIAGGAKALVQSIEGVEDDEEQAVRDMKAKKISAMDIVCGIAASIRTPYVGAAMRYAKSVGAATIFITANPRSAFYKYSPSPLNSIVIYYRVKSRYIGPPTLCQNVSRFYAHINIQILTNFKVLCYVHATCNDARIEKKRSNFVKFTHRFVKILSQHPQKL